MYEVNVLNRNTNKNFIKKFSNKKDLTIFVRKVKYSNTLTLLSITDNSYLYD